MDTVWFSEAPAAAVRLFCFPCAGGNAAAYLPWAELLGPRWEPRVALLPGRGTRLFDEPPRSMDELVVHLADAVAGRTDRPYVLFGHSLGALLAFEVARALRRRGLPGPDSLWVAGAEGPRTRRVPHRLHDLPDDQLIEALRDYGGSPEELLADREMMELLLPGLRADFAMDELYARRDEPPLDLPVHVLLGDRDLHTDAARAAGWADETTGPTRWHVFDGDHFFVHPNENSITALLVALAERAPAPRSAP